MRISRAAAFTLAVSAAVLFFAGCPGGQAPVQQVPAPGRPLPPSSAVAIELPSGLAPIEPGTRVTIPVHIVNRDTAPILVISMKHEIGNTTGTEDWSGAAPTEPREGGGLALIGTLSIEDVGAAARAPRPPKWAFQGSAEAVGGPVIGPGETYKTEVDGAAPLEGKDAPLRVTVSYAIAKDAPFLELVEARAEAIPPTAPPSASGRGWVPTARLVATYRPLKGAPSAPASPPTWQGVEALGPLAGEVSAGPPQLLLPRAAFDALPKQVCDETISIPLARPAFDLAAARRIAGLDATAMAAYIPSEKLWILLGPKSTYFVGEKRMAEVAGSVIPNDLAKSERVEISIPALDLAGPLLQAGFAVNARDLKGGGRGITIEVTRDRLFEFAQAVSDAGLGFNGLELRKP